ncbi:TetR/AcrR family transcriptional regulator [Halorussus litoreus]|uniref:TetR/AcrR family transcriptional regulator n=1 Tax=Halorussus litoreus TaxID=1710536 RepID=UPI000E27B6AF|nr:TetR/AcrR family transcriptional regulator [Halorussus litoreus]
MTDDADDGDGVPADTREAIMEATYAALCKHGYADLTMQAIADEFDMTKAVLHYHYDTKEDLLVSFLDYLLDQFLDAVDTNAAEESEDPDDPADRLVALVDSLVLGDRSGMPDDDRDARSEAEHWEYHTALLDVRAQAPHNDAFRDQLTTNYEYVAAAVATVVEDGVETGVFREVDPDRTAAWLLATINGARLHQVTLDADVAREVRDAIVEDWIPWLRRPESE